jgi:hypothetical protein
MLLDVLAMLCNALYSLEETCKITLKAMGGDKGMNEDRELQ